MLTNYVNNVALTDVDFPKVTPSNGRLSAAEVSRARAPGSATALHQPGSIAMSRAFSDIAFTPAVRAVQTRMGSRAAYARLDHADDRARRADRGARRAFIAARDGFYQATVSETGLALRAVPRRAGRLPQGARREDASATRTSAATCST